MLQDVGVTGVIVPWKISCCKNLILVWASFVFFVYILIPFCFIGFLNILNYLICFYIELENINASSKSE